MWHVPLKQPQCDAINHPESSICRVPLLLVEQSAVREARVTLAPGRSFGCTLPGPFRTSTSRIKCQCKPAGTGIARCWCMFLRSGNAVVHCHIHLLQDSGGGGGGVGEEKQNKYKFIYRRNSALKPEWKHYLPPLPEPCKQGMWGVFKHFKFEFFYFIWYFLILFSFVFRL